MRRCLGCMNLYNEIYDICPHCGYIVGTGAQNKYYLEPGTVLKETYLLGKVLGQGGFGITYIAWDLKNERPVAIKEYLPLGLASRVIGQQTVTCYSDETQAIFDKGLLKLVQENLTMIALHRKGIKGAVQVLDFFEGNDTEYIVMELLRGRTLKKTIEEDGTFSLEETISVIKPVLETLSAMHQMSIIHRDISPDNIFLCDDGQVKLLDFGSSRVLLEEDDEKTKSIILKHGYAPIEQYLTHGKIGSYTDIYAVGATMCKMLTGIVPDKSIDRLDDSALPPELAKLSLPGYALKALEKALMVYSDQRTQTVRELMLALKIQTKSPTSKKPAEEFAFPVHDEPDSEPEPLETEQDPLHYSRIATWLYALAEWLQPTKVAISDYLLQTFADEVEGSDSEEPEDTGSNLTWIVPFAVISGILLLLLYILVRIFL